MNSDTDSKNHKNDNRNLKNSLLRSIVDYKITLEEKLLFYTQLSMDLDKQLLSNSTYVVSMISAWNNTARRNSIKDKNTIYVCMGKLSDAIRLSEEYFKKTNNRSDIQADYFVYLKKGKVLFQIPPNYWNRFTQGKFYEDNLKNHEAYIKDYPSNFIGGLRPDRVIIKLPWK